MSLSLVMVRHELRADDVTIRRTQYGEYRVNFRGGAEATAYYTTDLSDALATGREMARVQRWNEAAAIEAALADTAWIA